VSILKRIWKQILVNPRTSAAGIAGMAAGIQIIVKNHHMIADTGTVALILGGLVGLFSADGQAIQNEPKND